MEVLALTIAEYGNIMRELGQREASLNSAEEQHKEVIKEDIERVSVRLAQAKWNMLKARTKEGVSLIEWNKESAESFFALADGSREDDPADKAE